MYCENVDIALLTAPEQTIGVKSWAIDQALAGQLWSLSEQLTGVPFNI